MKKQNRLGTYLAVAAGVSCVTSANAATVIFYGVDSANDTNADPYGIDFGLSSNFNSFDRNSSTYSFVNFSFIVESGFQFFTRGGALTGEVFSSGLNFGFYTLPNRSFAYGAQPGSDNYANLSFKGNDGIFEAVAQFHFDGMGGGFLVALAFADGTMLADGSTLLTSDNAPVNLGTLTNTSALSISDGFAAIDAASVPEPSGLTLLSLGALGLTTRRNRKQAD